MITLWIGSSSEQALLFDTGLRIGRYAREPAHDCTCKILSQTVARSEEAA